MLRPRPDAERLRLPVAPGQRVRRDRHHDRDHRRVRQRHDPGRSRGLRRVHGTSGSEPEHHPADCPPAATDPANLVGWKGETTLDVETAHAIAPCATIDLVEAKSNSDADILSATEAVAKGNYADVVSQSFGEAEACESSKLLQKQHAVFSQLSGNGTTLFASSGDQGAGLPTCDGKSLMKAASTPATDPKVTAVGGTDLTATAPTFDSTNHEVTPAVSTSRRRCGTTASRRLKVLGSAACTRGRASKTVSPGRRPPAGRHQPDALRAWPELPGVVGLQRCDRRQQQRWRSVRHHRVVGWPGL